MPNEITLDLRDGIATVTFNRPDRRNAIDYQGWLEIQRIATVLADDTDTRVVVFKGAGEEAFSAGADIKDFDKYRSDSTQAKKYSAAFDGALDAIEALPQPTICAIKGFCIGGGCELSMATDIRVSADNGVFGIPVAHLGILIGYREMRRLINLVGPGDASYILLSGRRFDTKEALEMGLVNQVVPLSELDGHVEQLARDMVPLAPLSQSRNKKIMRTVLANPSLGSLTAEQEHLPFANFDSEDFQEGRRAFLEHRKPEFTGR